MCRIHWQEDVVLATWEAEAEELLEDYRVATGGNTVQLSLQSLGTQLQTPGCGNAGSRAPLRTFRSEVTVRSPSPSRDTQAVTSRSTLTGAEHPADLPFRTACE